MGFLDIFRVDQIKQENLELKKKLDELGYTEYCKVQEAMKKSNATISENNATISRLRQEIENLSEQQNKSATQLKTTTNRVTKNKELYKSIAYSIDQFFNKDVDFTACKISASENEDLDLTPSVMLKLNYMNVKDLRKAFKDNDKQIESLMTQYAARYTTKANKSIYQLMVIALRAELQNILFELKYEKLDNSIETLKRITAKYLQIAGDGNQSIAGTLTKFIGEIEYLFINAVKIEYNYYVKKEQARQEQLAIREQMRQEAEERKALDAEKQKIEKEEAKYRAEMSKVSEQLDNTTDDAEMEKLKARLLELESQLSDVIVKKDEIAELQNGKAGTVYIISNLGSFGENVFKVGMTRRLDPLDRVAELSDASVPFKFDVHSFIFSQDAVSLEGLMHKMLETNRLNKVNRRKEFFAVSLDELEKLVYDIEPTAEFNRTMAAEEYYQSVSSDVVYEDSYIAEEDGVETDE